MPYEDAYSRTSHWRPAPYNSIWLNWKRGMYCMSTSLMVVEPLRHLHSNVYAMSQFYEYPKTRTEFNIFAKEVLRLPNFWKEMGKKVMFGTVTAAGDSALKLSMF